MKDIKPIKKDGNWIDILSGEELLSIEKTKRHPAYGVKLHNKGMTLVFKKELENFDDYLNNEKKRVIILELLQRNKSIKEIISQLEKKKIQFDDKIRKEIQELQNVIQ